MLAKAVTPRTFELSCEMTFSPSKHARCANFGVPAVEKRPFAGPGLKMRKRHAFPSRFVFKPHNTKRPRRKKQKRQRRLFWGVVDVKGTPLRGKSHSGKTHPQQAWISPSPNAFDWWCSFKLPRLEIPKKGNGGNPSQNLPYIWACWPTKVPCAPAPQTKSLRSGELVGLGSPKSTIQEPFNIPHTPRTQRPLFLWDSPISGTQNCWGCAFIGKSANFGEIRSNCFVLGVGVCFKFGQQRKGAPKQIFPRFSSESLEGEGHGCGELNLRQTGIPIFMTTFSYLEGSPYYNSSRGAQESQPSDLHHW